MQFPALKAGLAGVLCLLAGCAPAPTQPVPDPTEHVSAPRLPGAYVRTDGHGDIAVTVAGQVSCPPTSGAEAAAAVASTNAVRTRAGLAPVSTDPRLQRAAQEHACEMAGRGLMTHVGTRSAGPGARVKALGYRPRVTSENIAAGRMDLSRTLQEWASSPDHQANMVIPGLRQMGIGHAIGSDGKTAFWAAVYAQPR